MWIPSHIGLERNELVDTEAEDSLITLSLHQLSQVSARSNSLRKLQLTRLQESSILSGFKLDPHQQVVTAYGTSQFPDRSRGKMLLSSTDKA